ncbi:MAG: glycosyltransferase family 2 protein [Bacteroides sp.]|jgi:glycosyltransferase, group 2 family protein
MISICIPIHDVNVVPLVETLLQQAQTNRIEVEIILFDDKSYPTWRAANEQLREMKNVFYLPLIENIGRSQIRNRMADMATGEWLLFLDCDMRIMNENFLSTYASYTSGADDVICGGIYYGNRPKERDFLLQWRTEQKVLRHRRRISLRGLYEHVSTGNFMIRKAVFDTVRFDEKIRSYGQEDQVFSLELARLKIKPRNIENPTEHVGHESNELFVQKTETSLFNLVRIWHSSPLFHDQLYSASKRIRVARFLQRTGFAPVFRSIFHLFGGSLRKTCVNGHARMWQFSFYQMGYLLTVFRIPNLATAHYTLSQKINNN